MDLRIEMKSKQMPAKISQQKTRHIPHAPSDMIVYEQATALAEYSYVSACLFSVLLENNALCGNTDSFEVILLVNDFHRNGTRSPCAACPFT